MESSVAASAAAFFRDASATVFDSNFPVDSDGMRNVGECIMSRIKTWEFPKPKGGGMAIVTYPWILRSSGSGSAG